MVYSRAKAIDFLKECMMPHGNGAIFDQVFLGKPYDSKMFLWSDCALAAEVFRLTGDTARVTSITNVMHQYLDANHNPTKHFFSAMVDQSVFPSVFADVSAVNDWFQFCPYILCTDYCTTTTPSVVTSLSVNRAFLRCINSFKAGNTADALACWNHGMSFYDGWSLNFDVANNRYTSYQVFLQNYAAVLTGYTYDYLGNTITKVLPNHADVMQGTDPHDGEGKIRQFYRGNATDGYISIGTRGNVETTSIKILADILENGV